MARRRQHMVVSSGIIVFGTYERSEAGAEAADKN